jgi:DNA-binding GntR family transcriptional regulator
MATAVPTKSSPIPRQSLSAAVVERLREKILTGELREGEQLRQDAIANEFQISRIPVREALSHLAAEGLITIYANRGAVVSALSPDEIMQLFETRAVLECYMLRCAIPNMKEEDFQRTEDILKLDEESLEKDSEVKSWLEFPLRALCAGKPPGHVVFFEDGEHQLRPLYPFGLYPRSAPRRASASRGSRGLQDQEP